MLQISILITEMPPALQKRKESAPAHPLNARSAKRVKLRDQRHILAQSSEKALNKNGDLDVSAFVKARGYEIRAMGVSMAESKKALSTRAFQSVPRAMRRRTASHNIKRVPKRVRRRAAKEVRSTLEWGNWDLLGHG